jgi:RNA polymerase sigma-70 factor (ECF subfamily)
MQRTEDPQLEATLMARVQRGDDFALRALMRTLGPGVFSVARRLLSDSTAVEEVVQDTFVAVWRRPEAFDPARGNVRAFVLGIARKKAIDRWRKEAGYLRLNAALKGTAGDREEHADRIEGRVDLLDALARLSQRQREAINLAYFGGLTYKEVALNLGVPEGTAKTRLREGLMRLRRLLTSAA